MNTNTENTAEVREGCQCANCTCAPCRCGEAGAEACAACETSDCGCGS